MVTQCSYPFRNVSSDTSVGAKGGRMAVTVQMQFESVVTEIYQDAFVGSSIENGTTIIQFDLRKLDFQRALGTTSTICWRKEPYAVEIHELSTFHNPIKYRFIVAQGSYLNAQKVPELLVGSGATAIGSQHAQYPWTMGLLPAFAGEGAVYGRQIAAHQANAKIAVLYENDEYGDELWTLS